MVQELPSQPGPVPEFDPVTRRQTDSLVGEVARGDDRRLVGAVVRLGGGYLLNGPDSYLPRAPVLGLDRRLGAVPFQDQVSSVVRTVRRERDPVARVPEAHLQEFLELLAVHVIQITQARVPQPSVALASQKVETTGRLNRPGFTGDSIV